MSEERDSRWASLEEDWMGAGASGCALRGVCWPSGMSVSVPAMHDSTLSNCLCSVSKFDSCRRPSCSESQAAAANWVKRSKRPEEVVYKASSGGRGLSGGGVEMSMLIAESVK